MEPLNYLVVRYSNGEVGWGPRGLDTHDETGPNTSETVDATPLDQAAAKGKKGKQPPDASGHGEGQLVESGTGTPPLDPGWTQPTGKKSI